MYKTMGFYRKAAFFLRETAALHSKHSNFSMGHRLLQLACPFVAASSSLFQPFIWYQAVRICRYYHIYLEGSAKPTLRVVPNSAPGWPALQKFLLKDLIAISKNANGSTAVPPKDKREFSISDGWCVVLDRAAAPQVTAPYIVYLLQHMRHVMSTTAQQKFVTDLQSLSDEIPHMVCIDCALAPFSLLLSVADTRMYTLPVILQAQTMKYAAKQFPFFACVYPIQLRWVSGEGLVDL
jgi:hypothetical protein